MEAFISRRGRRALATAAVLVLGLAVTPSAMAGKASVSGNAVQFDAFLGETNNVKVSQLPEDAGLTPFRISDLVPITVGGGCHHISSNQLQVECRVRDPQILQAWLGNANDRLAQVLGSEVQIPMYVAGNPGEDNITTGNGVDTIDGGDHKDTLNGGAGRDTIYGGGNDDHLVGGTGLDKMYGELGGDRLDADDNAGGDLLDCGAGFDFAIWNPGDILTNNCDQDQQAT
jgi:hypothetical protein